MNGSNIDTAIQRLYAATATLRSRNYPDAIIDDLLDHLKLQEAEAQTQKKLVLFLLRLVDTHKDLHGAGHARHFIFVLLNAFSRFARLSSQESGILKTMTENWFKCIEARPNDKKYFLDVDGNESQLFRFHLEASDLELPRHYGKKATRSKTVGLSPLYIQYAPLIHLRIRQFMETAKRYRDGSDEHIKKDGGQRNDSRQIIYEHMCSARMWFNFIHPSIKYSLKHPAKIPEYYIDSFVEQYDRRVNRRLSRATEKSGEIHIELSKRASEYKSMFCTLMGDDYEPSPREMDGRMLVEIDSYFSDYHLEDSVDGETHVYGKAAERDLPASLSTKTFYVNYEGDKDHDALFGLEAPLEVEVIEGATGVRKDTVSSKPNIKKSWQDFLDLRKFFFFWDSTTLNLNHYSKLYDLMDINLNLENLLVPDSRRNNAISVFIMMLIHTGLSPLYLLDTKIWHKGMERPPPLPIFVQEGEKYKLIIDPPISRKVSRNNACLRTLKRVELHIPNFLSNYFNRELLKSKSYLFSFYDEMDDWMDNEIRIDMTMIRDFLKQGLKEHNLNISPELIANSFMNLYSTRYGMDPIVACYVSKNHYRIFNAPLHYIWLPQQYFNYEYNITSITVHKAIEDNDKWMADLTKLSAPVSLRKPLPNRLYGEIGYGSPQIPKYMLWSEFIGDIKKAIRSQTVDTLYNRHNLYSIYLYFALMLSTSLRPTNNPDIGWNSYYAKLGKLVLSEKLSPKHFEERLVPVAKEVGKMIDNLRANFEKFEELIIRHLRANFEKFEPERLFFFLDENYNPEEFTLIKIKEILVAENLQFPLPLNTARHYVSSTLYWKNVYHETAAMLMGHQTAGKEWLATFSSAEFSGAEDIFKQEIGKMLKVLTIEKIPYLPVSR